jgi:membrane protein implicated in regulation of membrane protease activity
MIGKTCLVTETIRPYDPGQVRLDGLVWTAVTKDNKETLETGELVRIVKIEGVKLIVERVKGEE